MKTLDLSDAMLERIARRFRVLGEPQRLRILGVLEAGPKTVGEIAAALDGSQPNISRHLQALSEAGLAGRRREGTSIYYSISDPVVFQLCGLVCKSEERSVKDRYEALYGSNS